MTLIVILVLAQSATIGLLAYIFVKMHAIQHDLSSDKENIGIKFHEIETWQQTFHKELENMNQSIRNTLIESERQNKSITEIDTEVLKLKEKVEDIGDRQRLLTFVLNNETQTKVNETKVAFLIESLYNQVNATDIYTKINSTQDQLVLLKQEFYESGSNYSNLFSEHKKQMKGLNDSAIEVKEMMEEISSDQQNLLFTLYNQTQSKLELLLYGLKVHANITNINSRLENAEEQLQKMVDENHFVNMINREQQTLQFLLNDSQSEVNESRIMFLFDMLNTDISRRLYEKESLMTKLQQDLNTTQQQVQSTKVGLDVVKATTFDMSHNLLLLQGMIFFIYKMSIINIYHSLLFMLLFSSFILRCKV